MPGGEEGMQGVVASILLQLPFFRHLFAWIGGHPAGQRPISPPETPSLPWHKFFFGGCFEVARI
jgi:hypothetical protein